MSDRTRVKEPTLHAAELWHVRDTISTLPVLRALLGKVPVGLRGREAGTHSTIDVGIHFPVLSSDLDAAAVAELGHIIERLRATPEMRIVIGGFAGHPGSLADNMVVALRRIAAIQNHLVLHGRVDPKRIGIGVRGAGWFLVERPGEGARRRGGNECRVGIHDPSRALFRN